MKKIYFSLILLLFCVASYRAQVTSNVFVQTGSSADFAALASSQPIIFNLADNSWYFWNGAAFVIYPSVASINTRTGAVTLDKTDVGLANVDNTSDANKPISTATTGALNLKLAIASNLSDLNNIATAKTNLSLNNVDNTSDATKNSAAVALTNKTISGASNTISAIAESSITNLTTDLAAKALAASPTFTGVVTQTGVTDTALNRTITAIGTTGNVTINKPAGTVNFAAGAGTAGVTVTNSIVTVNSIILPVVRTNDSTCAVKNIVASAGSFIVRMTANCTAATSIGWVLWN